MRRFAVKAIFRKEMKHLFRDKKTLFVMFGLPLLLYPILTILISLFMTSYISGQTETACRLEIYGEDPQLADYLSSGSRDSDGSFEVVRTGTAQDAEAQKEELLARIASGETDAALIMDGSSCRIISNSSVPGSSNADEFLADAMEEYRQKTTEAILTAAGMDADAVLRPFTIEREDAASAEQALGANLGGLIPMLLIMGVFFGTMYPAIDTTSGERERSTQETLMTFPVSSRELVTGKFLMVSVCGFMSVFLYLITVSVLGWYFTSMASAAGTPPRFNLLSFLPSVAVMLLAMGAFSLFIGALIMCLCSFAKSTKEASTYTSPLMMVVMLTGYLGMLDLRLTTVLSIVPVLNLVLLIKSVFVFEYNIPAIVLVLISNMAYAAVTVSVLAKLYTSERVLFGEGRSSLLERPSSREPGSLPAVGDGLITLLLSLILAFYLGALWQLRFGLAGVGMTQLLILAAPVFMAWFGRVDYKAVFSLKKPRLFQLAASVLLGAGSFILFNWLAEVLVPMDSASTQIYQETMGILFSDGNLAAKLFIVGLLPAICEEALFRGYLTASLKKMKPVCVIAVTAAVFALYHMNLFQGVYAGMMGLVLGWAVYRSGSIFCASAIHLTANSAAVILEDLAKNSPSFAASLEQLPRSSAVLLGLVFFAAGVLCLYRSTRKQAQG